HCSAENDPPPTYYLLCGGPVGVLTIEEQGNTVHRETDGLQSGPVHLQSVLYVVHKDIAVSLCSDTFREYMYGLDGEEKYHADFEKGEGVMTLPDFAEPFLYPVGFYQLSLDDMVICQSNLKFCAKTLNYPEEPKDAPQSSIYSKDDVKLGSKNTLICYITGFYPPHIDVSWTRNNMNVTDESSLSQYYINSDGTYKAVSLLSFTPAEGDIYTCTVEHTALDRPLTKTWVLLHTEAKVQHKDIAVLLCSNSEREMMYGVDGEESWHADFTQEKGVMTLPQFADNVTYVEGAYASAVIYMDYCKQNLQKSIQDSKHPAEPKVAPQTSVYSRNDVQLGLKNTLVCYIAGFYPPEVTVSWTRNNVNVTNQATRSRYYITVDGAFNLVSHLSFTPEQGDIYTCTVEHTALDRPLTKIWDVQVALPSVGPSVFCGVGLAAGLLGVAVGTFFLVKGNDCN
ncbi:hypothetical protein NFI96_013662, partial [Prochilodus magdalenae]